MQHAEPLSPDQPVIPPLALATASLACSVVGPSQTLTRRRCACQSRTIAASPVKPAVLATQSLPSQTARQPRPSQCVTAVQRASSAQRLTPAAGPAPRSHHQLVHSWVSRVRGVVGLSRWGVVFYTSSNTPRSHILFAAFSVLCTLTGKCRVVDAACGTAAGKACCPSQYHTATNPPLPAAISSMAGLCGGSLFCNTTSTTDAAGNYWPTGTCVANKPDCGSFGKPCCIVTSGVATSTQCGPSWGVGYCAYPGGKSTVDVQEQVCTPCPAVSVVAAEPQKYFGCRA